MSKRILGTYPTVKEVKDAIAIFELQGHESKNVLIFGNNLDDSVFQRHNIVNFETNDSLEDESFIEKIKDNLPIKDLPNFSTSEDLMEYGLSLSAAVRALTGVQNGLMVVIVDDELRMGHA